MNDQKAKSVIRQTSITITISIAAMAMGIIGVYLAVKSGKSPIVGGIVAVIMLVNVIIQFKTRRHAKDELMKNPRIV